VGAVKSNASGQALQKLSLSSGKQLRKLAPVNKGARLGEVHLNQVCPESVRVRTSNGHMCSKGTLSVEQVYLCPGAM
jgi:hypothetical protein